MLHGAWTSSHPVHLSCWALGTMRGSTTALTLTALLCLGLCRGPQDLVQAGVLPKPSIWADPGPMVTKGSHVTILCQGSLQIEVYSLFKEHDSKGLDTKIPRDSSKKIGFLIEPISSTNAGRYQCAYYTRKNSWSERSDTLSLVVTAVGPVNTSHGGTYTCYGSSSYNPNVWSQPSNPLHLKVTGVYRKPTLSAQPGPLVLPGDNVTLQCHSEAGHDRFALTKGGGLTHTQRLDEQLSPDFLLGRVTPAHGGRYRCYSGHNLSYAWSAPSAPLDVLITGMYRAPALSAQPGPSVPWGENVTLQCRSEVWFDNFHLYKEGSPAPPQHLRLRDTAAPSQANFPISPVTSAHGGTYRCYGSRSSSPYLLSHASDPLQLAVSGGSEGPPTTMETGLQRGLLNVLIGVSVAFVVLLSLLLFLFLRHRCQGKNRTSVAAASEPEDRGLQKSSSPAADVQEENLYAVVKDTQPEDRQLDSEVAASEDPQDVTYAQLNHLTLRRETSAPPSSPSEELPDEPSVYAALAIH
nr:PREDICTED: leukocyte immunoglobulin-like receptor subfamily B member 3 [Rhinolophus sinicus]